MEARNMELHDGFDVVLEGASGKRFPFKVELLDKRVSSAPASSSTRINLKSLDVPGVLHLMTLPKPSITNKVAPPNRNNILVFENVSSDTSEGVAAFRIRTLFGKDSPTQASRSALYLTDSKGVLQAIEVFSEIEASAVSATVFKVYRAESSDVARAIEQVVLPKSFLNKVQLRRFVSEGYLHLPSLIPIKDIQAVRKLLHHQLGQVGSLVPGAIQGGNYGKFGGEMTNHPKLRELVVRTQLRNVLEELLGAAIFNMTNLSCQVAFRFPEMDDEHGACPIDWHTDGERQGSSHPFTLLVGICLTDINEPYAGNLTVFPTSHWLMHRCKELDNGAINLDCMHSILASNETFSDLRCHPFREEKTKELLSGHVQLQLRAGDVVIMHSDLAHAGAPNKSDTIREMLYFRIKPIQELDWNEVLKRQYQDIWYELEGVKRALHNEMGTLSSLFTVPR